VQYAPDGVRYREFRYSVSPDGQSTRWEDCSWGTSFPGDSFTVAGQILKPHAVAHLQHGVGSGHFAVPLGATGGALAAGPLSLSLSGSKGSNPLLPMQSSLIKRQKQMKMLFIECSSSKQNAFHAKKLSSHFEIE